MKRAAAAQSDQRRVLGYVRVSTKDQGDNGYGLAAQRAAIEQACECRGWQLTGVLVDVASGASTKRRPELAKALSGLQSGSADVLMVAKLDRLARSTLDTAKVLDDAKREGWALVALDIGIDTTTPVGSMLVGILGAIAQWERDIISERTTKALHVARTKGVQLGRVSEMPPKVLRRIVRERERGDTLQAIADGLNDDGVPTVRGGIEWRSSTVSAAIKTAERIGELTAAT